MPLPPKVLSHFALLLKAEAAYNTYLAPSAATDGLAIIERPEWAIDYADNGDRGGRAAGSVGGLRRAPKSGRFLTLPAVMQPVGYGAAYDGTKFPNIHTLLRMAGYSVTTDVTVGAEKQTYLTESAVPPAVPFSASGMAYDGGEEALFSGALVDELTLEIVNGGIPKLTASIMAAMTQGLPTDVAVPAVTYAGAQVNPVVKANGLTWTLGAVVPTKVKSCTIADKRNLGALMLDNATGEHSGFVPGGERVITINATIEAAALATMNAYQIAELATAAAFSLRVGATQFSKFKIEADTVQIDDVARGDENNARTWELSMTAKPSTLVAYDMLRWIFD